MVFEIRCRCVQRVAGVFLIKTKTGGGGEGGLDLEVSMLLGASFDAR